MDSPGGVLCTPPGEGDCACGLLGSAAVAGQAPSFPHAATSPVQGQGAAGAGRALPLHPVAEASLPNPEPLEPSNTRVGPQGRSLQPGLACGSAAAAITRAVDPPRAIAGSPAGSGSMPQRLPAAATHDDGSDGGASAPPQRTGLADALRRHVPQAALSAVLAADAAQEQAMSSSRQHHSGAAAACPLSAPAGVNGLVLPATVQRQPVGPRAPSAPSPGPRHSCRPDDGLMGSSGGAAPVEPTARPCNTVVSALRVCTYR